MNTSCSAGHYCPLGTVSPTANKCPAGRYTDSIHLVKREDCSVCPARQVCAAGTGGVQRPPTRCAAGYYCPNGTQYATQYACLPGSFSNRTNLASASECDVCPAGSYCIGGRASIDGACAAGFFCAAGSSSAQQAACPAGTYSARTDLADAAGCLDCPVAQYCPRASIAPIDCPAGTFSKLNNTEQSGPGHLRKS